MIWVAHVGGWMTLIEASSKKEAVVEAKRRTWSASLLPDDVNESHIREASIQDVEWWSHQGGQS